MPPRKDARPRKPAVRPSGERAKVVGSDDQHLTRLIERMEMIGRVHGALRSTLNVDDLHTIILTTLVSHSALDFSRALLLGFDESRGVWHGISALGAADRAQHLRIQNDIAEEESSLADMVADLRAINASAEEHTLFNKSLRELSSHSFWITTFQRFSSANPLLDKIRQIEIHYPVAQVSDPSYAAARFMDGILQRESSLIVSRSELEKAGLPAALTDMLPSESLWAVIRTQKGMRLLLIIDKIFNREPLNGIDVLHVDWFVGQVALALENAEMFQDLESAYLSLRELDSMKSNFLATISHELRTPLTAINGYVQLMINNRVGGVSPGQKEVLERILAHSDLLTGKVNDLIEIAEMDSGRAADIKLEPVDPLNALMTVLPRVEQRRAFKGITIQPEVQNAIPPILSNPAALERIFFHLLDNAVKFGRPNGHVRIEFEERDGELQVHMIDDGIGISKNQLDRIFGAFYQVDNRLTRHYEGLGIGLAIIRKQLDQTGGRIDVKSEPGRGSTFSVIYPLANR